MFLFYLFKTTQSWCIQSLIAQHVKYVNLNAFSMFKVLSFWYRIVSGSKNKICYKLYQLMHYLHENDLFHSDWVKTVHNTLNTLGLSDIWLSHDTFYSRAAFKIKVKTRISDQFKQEWKSNIDE